MRSWHEQPSSTRLKKSQWLFRSPPTFQLVTTEIEVGTRIQNLGGAGEGGGGRRGGSEPNPKHCCVTTRMIPHPDGRKFSLLCFPFHSKVEDTVTVETVSKYPTTLRPGCFSKQGQTHKIRQNQRKETRGSGPARDALTFCPPVIPRGGLRCARHNRKQTAGKLGGRGWGVGR